MIKMFHPSGRSPERIRLNTGGATIFPKDAVAFVWDEREADEMEKRFGWVRGAAAKRAASERSDMLRKGAQAQVARMNGSPVSKNEGIEQHRHQQRALLGVEHRDRVEIGEVESAVLGGRIMVMIDENESVITLHGVSSVMDGEMPKALHTAILTSAAAFVEAQNDAEQTTQREVIGALVDRVLRQNDDLKERVRGRMTHQRYGAV